MIFPHSFLGYNTDFQIIMSLLGSFIVYSFDEKSSRPFQKEILNFLLLKDNLVRVSFVFVNYRNR